MKKSYIISIILIILFIIDAYLMVMGKTLVFDNYIYSTVRKLDSGFFDFFFKFVTKAGNVKYVLILLTILNLKLSKRNSFMCNLLTLTCVGSNTIIKYIFKRSRPDVLRLIKQGGYSFPSGHSMLAFTLYLFLLYIVIKEVSNKYLKVILSIILIILIPSILLSRVYVGVHFGSDILGGAILGLAEFLILLPTYHKISGGE